MEMGFFGNKRSRRYAMRDQLEDNMVVGKTEKSFLASVISLIAHLIGTAVIFSAIFFIGWLVSLALYGLHQIHAFPPEIFKFVTTIEVWLVYVDTGISALVLLAGTIRFCKDVIGD